MQDAEQLQAHKPITQEAKAIVNLANWQRKLPVMLTIKPILKHIKQELKDGVIKTPKRSKPTHKDILGVFVHIALNKLLKHTEQIATFANCQLILMHRELHGLKAGSLGFI